MKKEIVSLTLHPDLIAKLKQLADEKQLSVSSLVTVLLNKALRENENGQNKNNLGR